MATRPKSKKQPATAQSRKDANMVNVRAANKDEAKLLQLIRQLRADFKVQAKAQTELNRFFHRRLAILERRR